MAEERFELGGVALVAVRNQGVLAAQTEASLPPLRAQHAQASHTWRSSWAIRPRRPMSRRSRLRRPATPGGASASAAVRTRPATAGHPRERGPAAQGERQRRRRNRRSVPKVRHLRRILVKSAQHRGCSGQRHQYLEHRHQPAPALASRRRAAGAEAGGRGRIRAGAGGVPQHGASWPPERRRRAPCPRSRMPRR